MEQIHNPYWEAVRPHVVRERALGLHGALTIQRWREDFSFNLPDDFVIIDRDQYTHKYAWSVTDPASVDFVAYWTAVGNTGLVDPMAGTGYWAYVLRQVGVDVVCYDRRPETNPWRKGQALWVPVEKMEGAKAAALHSDRTLFLSWPPYNEPDGNEILAAYTGERVIFIGEGYGNATGDDAMHERFERDWKEVDEHVPVQWDGIFDRITIYERKPDELADHRVDQQGCLAHGS
jgi:hypothetical protein